VLPARWSPREEQRAEERDGAAPACWERSPDWKPAHVPARIRLRVRREAAGPLLRARHVCQTLAEAGADRKESDLAGGPAAQDGLESESHGGRPEV